MDIDRKTQQYQAAAMVDEYKKNSIAEGWTKEQEDILKEWAGKAAGYRWLHEQSARHFRHLNNRFTYPQIILSTLAGVGGFGISTSASGTHWNSAGIVIAGFNITSALLVSFQKFISAAEKSETHNTVSRQLDAFYRNITMELSLSPGDRTASVELCKQCRNEYDRLMNVAPSVPHKIIRKFQAKFPNVRYKPDIANGLSDMKVWEDSAQNRQEATIELIRSHCREVYSPQSFSGGPENNV